MFCLLSPNHLWFVCVSLHFADALSLSVHEMKENKLYQHYQNGKKFWWRSWAVTRYRSGPSWPKMKIMMMMIIVMMG